MEVRAVSSSKKITVELSINVDKIEYKVHVINQNLKCFRRFFVIPLSDGTSYNGVLRVWKNHGKNEGISLHIENAKVLSGTVSLMISKGKLLSHCEIKSVKGKKVRSLRGIEPTIPFVHRKKMKRLKKKLHGKHTELLGIIQLGNQRIIIR